MKKRNLLSSGFYILVQDGVSRRRIVLLSELCEKWHDLKRKKEKRKKLNLYPLTTKNGKEFKSP